LDLGEPAVELAVREGAGRIVPAGLAGNLGEMIAPLDAGPDSIGEAGSERGLREIAVARIEPCGDIARRLSDVGLRPRAAHVRLPFLPERAVELLIVLTRLGRHFVEQVGLDRALVGS